jgi:hypothetical protein
MYHSALHAALKHTPRQYVSAGQSVAMAHDLMSSSRLPPEFDGCDVFYTDLPWKDGFAEFDKRANVEDGRTYSTFMARVAEIIRGLSVPVVIVAGKRAVPLLPQPRFVLPTKLNGAPAMAIVYGDIQPWEPGRPAWDILASLSQSYGCIGDFCCGYGRSAKVFADAGKRFVVSDYNAECIGAIGNWLEGK